MLGGTGESAGHGSSLAVVVLANNANPGSCLNSRHRTKPLADDLSQWFTLPLVVPVCARLFSFTRFAPAALWSELQLLPPAGVPLRGR
jgi:hypothetical protein